MELVLIRHGRVQGNPLRPQDDTPLGDVGRRQAQQVAGRLAQDAPPYDALLCSPLRRAQETAHVIGAQLSLQPQVVDELIEMRRHEMWQLLRVGLASRVPLLRRHPNVRDWQRWKLVARAGNAIAKVINDYARHQRLLVVAHGGIIWGALVHFFPEQRVVLTRNREVQNCSITRLAFEGAAAKLLSVNETQHLGEFG